MKRLLLVLAFLIGSHMEIVASVPLQPDSTVHSSSDDRVSHGAKHFILPQFAVKTNLLFDLASAFNIEIEVPVGKRWSVAGEWVFPWWLWKKQQVCLQVLSGTLEGRYWLRDQQKIHPLTGWFAGLYTGAGLYDLEWKTRGYQGEFFIAAGVSGGYAHTINKSGTLRLEYLLGIGYMQTKYRQYIPVDGGEILSWQKNGRYSWFGPTRAKVSLVWLVDFKNWKGGRK